MNWNAVRKSFYRSFLKSQSVVNVLPKRNKPICSVSTNLPADKVSTDFLKEMTKVISDVLNKPENMITVKLETDAKVWRGVEDAPTAHVDIWSIGVFDAVSNQKYSPLFYQFLNKHFDIPEDRITLVFHPLEATNVGHLTQIRLRQEGKDK